MGDPPPPSGGDILGLCRHMDQNISTGVDGGLIGDTGARTLLEIDKQQNKIGSHTKLYFVTDTKIFSQINFEIIIKI